MLIARRLLLILLLVGVLVAGWRFAAANSTAVAVDFLVAQSGETALWLTLLVAFGVGALAATALCLFEIARLGLISRRYRKTVGRLEAEIHQLRNLPLAGEGALPGPTLERER